MTEKLITLEVKHTSSNNMESDVQKAISDFKRNAQTWPYCSADNQPMKPGYGFPSSYTYGTSVYFSCEKCGKMGREERLQGLAKFYKEKQK